MQPPKHGPGSDEHARGCRCAACAPVSPTDALAAAHKVLLRAVDGHGPILTAAEGEALKAALWDAGNEAQRQRIRREAAEKRAETLATECDHLVAQVVSEEARAFKAERELWAARSGTNTVAATFAADYAELVRIVEALVAGEKNTKRLRDRARIVLENRGRVA